MHILITGASRGIGYELAKYFAVNGAEKIFLLSRNHSKIQHLNKECLLLNPKIKIVELPFSLEDENSFDLIKKAVAKETNHLDVLVNNAGTLVNKAFDQITEKELKTVYAVNVFGPFRLIQTLLPFFGGEKRSHIVNIGSMGGVQGASKFPGLSAYTSSKMAIAGLTECLAEEFKDKNIFVNCLAIGAVQTEMLNEAFPGYKPPHEAHEMAEYIGDFALNAQRFINGKIIPVALSTP